MLGKPQLRKPLIDQPLRIPQHVHPDLPEDDTGDQDGEIAQQADRLDARNVLLQEQRERIR